MNLIHIFNQFPTHEACIAHLENVRWGESPACPYCGGLKVARKEENARVGRWNCYACRSSFNVLSGTIFQKTKIPLQKWFLAAALVLNAKKSVSSHQLARDLEMNQKSAWFMALRIRRAMTKGEHFLAGIVEMDETYVGGKPRKSNRRDDDMEGGNKSKRGRGTDKLPVVGAVERGGNVVAKPVTKSELTGKGLYDFVGRHISKTDSVLITDEYPGYRHIGKKMLHETIKRKAGIY